MSTAMIITLSLLVILFTAPILIYHLVNKYYSDKFDNINDYFDKQDSLKMKFHRLYNREVTSADLIRARENIDFKSKNQLIQWLIDDYYKKGL